MQCLNPCCGGNRFRSRLKHIDRRDLVLILVVVEIGFGDITNESRGME